MGESCSTCKNVPCCKEGSNVEESYPTVNDIHQIRRSEVSFDRKNVIINRSDVHGKKN